MWAIDHEGVEPDILFPTAPQGAEHGERSLENALPWNSILILYPSMHWWR